MRYINLSTLTLLALVMFASCRDRHHEEHTAGYRSVADTIFIDPEGTLHPVIKTRMTSSEMVSRTLVTAGTVKPIPTQYAFIAPPFSGRIVRSHIQLGQAVGRNAPLFEVISPDFTSVQKEFLQAQSDTEYARLDLCRKQDLLANGVGSQREYEEALNTLRIAEKELENATAALKIYNADPNNIVLGEPMVIRSPLRGTVIENNIVTGLYLGEDAEPVAVVANLDKVWITAQVKEKDIRHISEGDPITVRVTAFPEEEITGTVYHVDEAVDEETRSIKVLSVCDNSDEKLKLGMYATISFSPAPQRHTLLPERAVLQGVDSGFVFVKVAENTYVRRMVEVDFSEGGKAYVRDWPYGDAEVISEGGYLLI